MMDIPVFKAIQPEVCTIIMLSRWLGLGRSGPLEPHRVTCVHFESEIWVLLRKPLSGPVWQGRRFGAQSLLGSTFTCPSCPRLSWLSTCSWVQSFLHADPTSWWLPCFCPETSCHSKPLHVYSKSICAFLEVIEGRRVNVGLQK